MRDKRDIARFLEETDMLVVAQADNDIDNDKRKLPQRYKSFYIVRFVMSLAN